MYVELVDKGGDESRADKDMYGVGYRSMDDKSRAFGGREDYWSTFVSDELVVTWGIER